MVRFSLLLLSAVFAALGALTFFRSPDWSNWKLALFAGEFGHWLAVAALLLGIAAWCARAGHGAVAGVTVVVSVVAAGLLLKPTMHARRIGATLPGELVKAFGGVAPVRAAFAVGNYFSAAVKPVAVEMREFAPGLKLDFYRAVKGTAAPCVIVIHGGGWDSGDREQLPEFNHWLARLGYAVVAIDYRLAPKFIWPAQRDDTLAAMAYVKAHAAELGVDATRLVLFGRSAGGQIASAVAYGSEDPAIRGLVSFYAPHDMFFAYTYAREDDILKSPALMRQYLGGPPAAAKANYESASGHQRSRRGSPPTLMVHGTIDTLVWYRHSVRLDGKLTDAHVPHAYVALPWATHAFEYNLAGPSAQLATYALEHFLAVVTK
ncbi:MAG: alpha/beta hydrolase [Undibacterium sp.]|nr:alpha/beta hydrolase [Opitutaceae bacterium]